MDAEPIEQPKKKPLSKFTLVTGIVTIFSFVVTISSIPFGDFFLECMRPELFGNHDVSPFSYLAFPIFLLIALSGYGCLMLSICLAIHIRQVKGGIKGYLAALSCIIISISQMVIMSKVY